MTQAQKIESAKMRWEAAAKELDYQEASGGQYSSGWRRAFGEFMNSRVALRVLGILV